MMQWMCKIALLIALLTGWFADEAEPREQVSVTPQIVEAQSAAELVAEVRRHCHLNLPSSFETLPSSVRLQMRTPAKQTSSRLGAWSITSTPLTHKQIAKSYGGLRRPQTATMREPHVVLTQLCRWII